MAVAALAKKLGLETQGVISPAIFENGEKIGILVEDAASGVQHKLATLRKKKTDSEIQTEHWVFDSEGVALGNEILAHCSECDVLIVDELGPLEFIQQQGWLEGLTTIEKQQYRLAVVVIRKELLEEAGKHWKDNIIFTVNPTLPYKQQAANILTNLEFQYTSQTL